MSNKKKHTYYITIPLTGSVEFYVETDEPIEDESRAYELAMNKWEEALTGIDIVNGDRTVREDVDIQIGEYTLHRDALDQGNVCHATCPGIEWGEV